MDAGTAPAQETRSQYRHELRTLIYACVEQANGVPPNAEREPRWLHHGPPIQRERTIRGFRPVPSPYSVMTAPPHVNPLPNAANSTFDPLPQRPSRQASLSPRGIVAAVVLP